MAEEEGRNRIFCLIGKSASGKDTIYRKLLRDPQLPLKSVLSYTTRPMRSGEKEGKEYHFRTREQFEKAKSEGRIIEYRRYDTVYGPWFYYTEDDGQISFEESSYLVVGVLQSYLNMRDYFGKDLVIPLYMEVEDGERLQRALNREKHQKHPGYAEMCRRFLADTEDFSDEKLKAAGITKRFENRDVTSCEKEIREYILDRLKEH